MKTQCAIRLHRILLISSVFGLLSCSLSPLPQTVNVQLRLSESSKLARSHFGTGNRSSQDTTSPLPTSATSFDCFFASVTANDITNELDKNNDLNGVEPSCLGRRVSTLVSNSNFFDSGVSLSVLSGNERKVSVFGVMTKLGSACNSKTLRQVFAAGSTAIYKVGESTGVEIVSGANIVVNTVFDANSPQEDLVGSCGPRVPLYLAGVYSGVGSISDTNSLPPNVGIQTLPLTPPAASGPMLKLSTNSYYTPAAVVVFGIPYFAQQKLAANSSAYTKLMAQIVTSAGHLTAVNGLCPEDTEPSGAEFDLRIFSQGLANSDLTRKLTSVNEVFTSVDVVGEFSYPGLATVNRSLASTDLIQTTGKKMVEGESGQFITFAIQSKIHGGARSSEDSTRSIKCAVFWLKSIRAFLAP